MDKQREDAVLTIAASLVAVIRLRGEPIKPSPKLTAVVGDAVLLVRQVLSEIQRR